jgi:hypothetical protein
LATDRRRYRALIVAAALLAGACGKKGAPLAPIVRIPAAVTKVAAARMGSDVYITVTVPAENIDASVPADVGRVDVYAYTGRLAPPAARFAEVATVVASIPVAPPPDPQMPVPTPPFGFVDPEGAWQGTTVTVRERLSDDELVHGPDLPVDSRAARQLRAGMTVPPPPTGALKRFYLAIPFSRRGRPGPPGTPADFALTDLPDAPALVHAQHTSAGVHVTWEPSGGLLGFILEQPLLPEPPPFDAPVLSIPTLTTTAPVDPAVPPGPTTYNVYRELSPDPLQLPEPSSEAAWSAALPVPVNPGPVQGFTVSDEIEFGRMRCYTVRAIRGTAPAVMSAASPPVCVTPMDVFPPAAPTGLAAVPSEGGISLIWEPNAELDLGGYLVLRRDGADATLRQLTDTPIVDARFRDTTVTPGVRYTYSVVAVDAQLPLPNVSGESEPVEEIAR